MQAGYPSVPSVNTAQLLPCWALEGAGEAAVAAGQRVFYCACYALIWKIQVLCEMTPLVTLDTYRTQYVKYRQHRCCFLRS